MLVDTNIGLATHRKNSIKYFLYNGLRHFDIAVQPGNSS